MNTTRSAHENLDYVADVVQRENLASGTPSIYFLWAVIVLVGFALPDFAPKLAGLYWFICGTAGGFVSWFLAAHDAKAKGVHNKRLGRRYGFHWLVTGIGFILAALPMITGVIDPANGASLFLLVGGIGYCLAGIHLERGILPGGILMLVAYVLLLLVHPPYIWTLSGIAVAIALAWAGVNALRAAKA